MGKLLLGAWAHNLFDIVLIIIKGSYCEQRPL